MRFVLGVGPYTCRLACHDDRRLREQRLGGCVHGLVHLIHRKLAVDLLHSLAGLLHGGQRLAVDVGRLDSVDLLLQRPYLGRRLLQVVLVSLLPLQGSPRGCLSVSRCPWKAAARAARASRAYRSYSCLCSSARWRPAPPSAT